MSRRTLAVVFDMDGVLVDTEHVWDEVRAGLAREHGIEPPPDMHVPMMGMSTPEWARHMVEQVGVPLSADEVAEVVVGRVAERHRAHLAVLDGAVEAVARVRAAGLGTAVASSSPARVVATVVEQLGLGMDALVSSEEVERGKPAPDVYLEAARRLGFDPAACAGVEDSSNGLRAAHAAGLHVLAVPHAGYPPADDALALADRVLGGLAELDPAALP